MSLIFVGGCERSGTSLVQKILASHSRIAGGPELVFTSRIAELYRRMEGRLPAPYSSRIEAFYDRGELAELFRGFFAGLFRRVLERKPGALYFSEKTPSNIFAAATLLEIFPDARFIHVLRDGRDVLGSNRDVRARFEAAGEAFYHRASFSTHRVCARWNRAAEAHHRLAGSEEVGGRYFLLRYEELVRDPRRLLTELFDWLGLGLEARALAPETIGAEEIGVPVDGFWTTEEMDRQAFDPSRIGRWRHSLPWKTRALANLLMAGELRRLAYPVAETYVVAHRPLRWLWDRLTPTRWSRGACW